MATLQNLSTGLRTAKVLRVDISRARDVHCVFAKPDKLPNRHIAANLCWLLSLPTWNPVFQMAAGENNTIDRNLTKPALLATSLWTSMIASTSPTWARLVQLGQKVWHIFMKGHAFLADDKLM
jgi:hypothetical protein